MSVFLLHNLALAQFFKNPFIGERFACLVKTPNTPMLTDIDDEETGAPGAPGAPKPATPDATKKPETGTPKPPETTEKPKAETAAEKKDREIEEIQRHIRNQIFHTLNILAYYREAAPTAREKRPFEKWIRELDKINDEDAQNENAIKTILKAAYQSNKISLADAHAVMGYNAKDKNECKKKIAGFAKVDSYEKKQMYRVKTQEWNLEARFDKIFGAIVDHVNRINRRVSDYFEKQNIIESAEKSLGISLAIGAKIEYMNSRIGQKAVMEIASVETRKKKIKLGKNREDEVWEPLTITTKDGQVFTIARLDKFLRDNAGQEIIENKLKLEEAIGWNFLDFKIEAGTEIEYDAGDPDDLDKYVPRRVKILEVTDKEITLENEVLLRKDTNERKSKLSLGEFATWMRQTRAQKAIDNIDELRETLTIYSNQYANHHHLNPDLYPPIQVEKGEKMYTGGDLNNVRQIKNVTTDSVELKNGDKMTFAQFLRWVQDHHAQKFDPKNEGEKWKKTLEEAGMPHDDAEAAAKKREEELKKTEEAKKKAEEEAAKKGKEGKSDKPSEPLSEHAPIHDNAIREWWMQTTWIGPYDIAQLVKHVYEYIGRRHERNTKRRFSTVGKNLPTDIKYEFERIRHEAEHEEVHKYQDSMKTMSILEIQEIMNSTSDQYQMKACFAALAERGQIRWEDPHMWNNLNKFLPGRLQVPKPEDMPKGKSAIDDYLALAIDYLWGARTFNDWHNSNNDKYNSQKKQFHQKGDQLEGSPNNVSITDYLAKLLEKHKSGEWVDPQEYEGMIDFTITKGKSTNEARLYYLIEGVTAKNAHGNTILSLDRFGNLDGEFLNQLPWLDFFTGKSSRLDKDGNPQKEIPWSVESLTRVANWWQAAPDANALGKRFKPNSRVKRFLWMYVLPADRTYTRIEKGIRSASKMDHDDAQVIMPLVTATQAEKTLRANVGTGEAWTDKAKANVYAGFAQYIKSLGMFEKDDMALFGEEIKQSSRLKRSLKAFVTFDTICASIYKHDDRQAYYRLDKETLDAGSVVDPATATRTQQTEVRKIIQLICQAYKQETLYKDIYETPLNPANKTKVDQAIDTFGDKFDEMVAGDPDRMIRVIKSAIEKGDIKGMSDQIFDKSQAERAFEESQKAKKTE